MTGPNDDDKLATLEMIAAMPGTLKLIAMTKAVVFDALAVGLDGKRKRSCLHLTNAVNCGGDGYRGPLPIGWRRTFDADRMAYLCVRHPDRLLCDTPLNPLVSPGCADAHMAKHHQDEIPAVCFTCSQPIPEDEVLPVFAVITLGRPLTVDSSYDRCFQYRGVLQTLPITYQCQRHRDQVDLPIRMTWPQR